MLADASATVPHDSHADYKMPTDSLSPAEQAVLEALVREHVARLLETLVREHVARWIAEHPEQAAKIFAAKAVEQSAERAEAQGRRIGPLARQAAALNLADDLRAQLGRPGPAVASHHVAQTLGAQVRQRGSSRQARPGRRTQRAAARSPGRLAEDDDPPPRAPLTAAERYVLRLEISRRRRRALHREAGLRRELLAEGSRP
jgi:hypothetical protein